MKNRTYQAIGVACLLAHVIACQALWAADPLQPLFRSLPHKKQSVLDLPGITPINGVPVYTNPTHPTAVSTKATPAKNPVPLYPAKSSTVANSEVTPNNPTEATVPVNALPTQASDNSSVLSKPSAEPAKPVLNQVTTPMPTVAPVSNSGVGTTLEKSLPTNTNTAAAVSEGDQANGFGTSSAKPVATPFTMSPPGNADQQARITQLQTAMQADRQWLADALALRQALAGSDALPTDQLLTLSHEARLLTAWQRFYQSNAQPEPALARARQARQQLNQAVALAAPSFRVEGRALWLDRGSLVTCQTPEALRALLKHIHQLGINTVFIETMNAGFANYNSKLIPKNPLLNPQWDPLTVAVETGHQLGMEVHAWVWCFAVGNVRHNAIINQPPEYPGPILAEKGMMSEALRGVQGNLIPRKGIQHEYWLSPASQRAKDFLVDVYKEIVSQYGVDGLQLDYIRYPFQNSGAQMGFEPVGRQRFEEETGLYLNAMDDYTLKSFIAWKTYQVTRFVEQVATTLKAINPQLKISGAVYPMRRTERIIAIQQDWETWLDKGWMDFLAPMTYTPSPQEYQATLHYLKTTTQKPAIIYPGLALHRLNGEEMVRLQDISRQVGWLGQTLFANAHLNPEKNNALAQESYRFKPAIPPHRDPAQSARLMVLESLQLIEAAQKLGDRQFDNWQPLLKQVDTAVGTLQGLKMTANADVIKHLQPQIQAVGQQCLRSAANSQTPYRLTWMGMQLTRLSQLLGYIARENPPGMAN